MQEMNGRASINILSGLQEGGKSKELMRKRKAEIFNQKLVGNLQATKLFIKQLCTVYIFAECFS